MSCEFFHQSYPDNTETIEAEDTAALFIIAPKRKQEKQKRRPEVG
jgi:hypothetical protein